MTATTLSQYDITTLKIARTKFKGRYISQGILRGISQIMDSPEATLAYIQDFLRENGGSYPTEQEIAQEIKDLDKLGASIITCTNPLYSQLLRLIPDYPMVLTCKGNIKLLNNKSISIIGSRNASLSGMRMSGRIASEMSRAGFTIVSGMARGIDAEAHKGANGNTIAVLAGGIGHIYPVENTDLYHDIATKGLLISENKIGYEPSGVDFRARNRIIAGLSLGTCVVEATESSGSLTTVGFATEYNRDVFAVPGQPLDPRSHGTNKLIAKGANIVATGAEDIISNLSDMNALLSNNTNWTVREQKIEKIDPREITENMRRDVRNCLSYEPVSIELIHTYSKVPMRYLHLILLELELLEVVKRHAGMKFSFANDRPLETH